MAQVAEDGEDATILLGRGLQAELHEHPMDVRLDSLRAEAQLRGEPACAGKTALVLLADA